MNPCHVNRLSLAELENHFCQQVLLSNTRDSRRQLKSTETFIFEIILRHDSEAGPEYKQRSSRQQIYFVLP